MTQEEGMDVLLSGKNVFLTGKAGTGKTYLTNAYIQDQRDNGNSVIVVAPTGIAAINIGGATIHSTFKMYGTYLLKRAINTQSVNWMQIRTVVIDEISMVGPDYIDYIDYLLQEERGSDLPFGGIQMIFVGDKNQLPPVYVAKEDDEKLELEKLKAKYGELTFDNAKSYHDFTTIELTDIKRTDDEKLITLLNKVRLGNIGCISEFNQGSGDDETVHLKPYNFHVDKHNLNKFNQLKGEERTYTGTIKGDFKQSDSVTPFILRLKVGARIMITKNIECGLVNGDLGTVVRLGGDHVIIHSDRYDKEYIIQEEEWKKIVYSGMSESVKGTFRQIPIKLAWAMTIHKSQGLTLDNVCVTYVKGMSKELVYVGLSRATTYEKLFVHY